MVSKFVPFCPCCQSYHSDDKHQNHCLLGRAEQRIAELEATVRRLCDIYVVDDYYSGEEREKQIDKAVESAIDRTRGKFSEVKYE